MYESTRLEALSNFNVVYFSWQENHSLTAMWLLEWLDGVSKTLRSSRLTQCPAADNY